MLFDDIKQKISDVNLLEKSLIINEVNKDLKLITSILCFLAKKQHTIIICNSLEEAEHTFNIAKNIFNIKEALFFPDFNIDPYSKASPSSSIYKNRINTLYELTQLKFPTLLITTIIGFLYKTVDSKYIKNNQIKIEINKEIQKKNIIDFLVKSGFNKVDTVSTHNTFSERGDIIDIFSNDDLPYRISLFDNIIESIKTFDPNTQRTIDNINSIKLKLSSEITLNKESIDNFVYEYQLRFGSFAKNDLNRYAINNNMLPYGAESYLPILVTESCFIYNYFIQEKDKILFVVLDNVIEKFQEIWHMYNDSYKARISLKNIKNDNLYYVLPPNELLLPVSEANNIIADNLVINVTNRSIPEQKDTKNLSINAKDPSFLFSKKEPLINKSYNLVKYLLNNRNCILVININNDQLIKLVISELDKVNLKYQEIHSLDKVIKDQVNIINNEYLNHGFISESFILICEADLININKNGYRERSIKAKNRFGGVGSITPNEYVVHVKHGVGKFIGLQTIDMQGIARDFLTIQYKDEDKLYLPVENIDLIGRYGNSSGNITLDKLGSSTWEKKQSRIKGKLKDIAYDLIKLSASRNINKGPIIDIDNEVYTDFVTKFPYIETEDQLSAISDIENDFKIGKIMDRLVCGDVGFGKTEVAMRATFLAAYSGYQVAIIAPTTLLCRQHYNNFKERFASFNLEIRQLSKFVSVKDKKDIKQDISNGKIDIIIGTHALLAKDIHFKNLGLLIIDEEQNFGVVHKEKLKTLRENIHVLTLTATPIPRTLQLALTKVKDLSIIATPPINKLSIKSYVMPYDALIIKEAITREILRRGQVFYVTPYIKDLSYLEEQLINFNNEWKIIAIHGSLTADQIEKGMEEFQDKKFDILLSTGIIESGIDLRNVNTIIINKADKFGLSQLYQLRGRVGRGNLQAFAYITYKSNVLLTEAAEKRLTAIQNLDYLGAGFSLSEHDLDIRGAGNILGEEQSGHIKEIGFDLYQKFLAIEIEKAKNNKQTSYESLSANINLNIPTLIPKYYIPDMKVRMDIYDRLANCENNLEIDEISDEVVDRFGKIPDETLNLMTVIKIKIICKHLGVEKIFSGSKGVSIYFINNKVNNFEKLMEYISNNKDILKIKPDSSIYVSYIEQETSANIRQLLTVLNDLKHILI